MKIYVWKHKDTAIRDYNFYPLSKSEAVGENGFRAVAIHAFFKKKDAEAYLREIGWEEWIIKNYELLTIEVKK